MRWSEGSWVGQPWACDVRSTSRDYNLPDLCAVRSFPAVIGVGSLYSAVLGLYQITGGSLMGPKKDPDRDEFAEKMKLRANRRRPIQETIDELGEGRGM